MKSKVWFFVTIALFVLLIISVYFNVFFAQEHVKKFGFELQYMQSSPLVRQWNQAQSERANGEKGMRNIVIRSINKTDFSTKIGFWWSYGGDGIDPIGYGQSKNGVLVISTYFGSGNTDFFFLFDKNIAVEITSSAKDQELAPDVICPPHWWQKLGIFG